MTNWTVRSILGSIGSLALVAGCTTDAVTDELTGDTARTPTGDSASTGDECDGENIGPGNLSGSLTIDHPRSIAILTILNLGSSGQQAEAFVELRDSRGAPARVHGEPVSVGPGSSATVRFSLAEIALDSQLPTVLEAQITARDASGAVSERAFARASMGPSLTAAAAALGVPTVQTLRGQTFELGGITRGGRGIIDGIYPPTHDDDEQITQNPNLPTPSHSFNMCFRWPVSVVDAGFGEDYGIDPGSPWIARGGKVSIVNAGKKLFDGYLDTLGCTGPFQSLATTNFTIFGYSQARINGNNVIARDADGKARSFVIWDADPGFNKNPVYAFPEVEHVSTMLAVGAYTMQKFHAGMTGETIALENRCKPGGCCNCASDGSIWLDEYGAERKFAISHEMGHRLLGLYIGSYTNDVSFDLDPTDMATSCDTDSGHAMWSAEFESGAAMEGWANFIAAATYNDRAGNNPGASLRYWSGDGVTVDVEQGNPGFPSNYFENLCTFSSPNTLGTELDWMRHWWDYYTNSLDVDPGSRPTVKQMMDELDAAPAWGSDDAWASIREGVLSVSGDEQLSRWDQHGEWNGID